MKLYRSGGIKCILYFKLAYLCCTFVFAPLAITITTKFETTRSFFVVISTGS